MDSINFIKLDTNMEQINVRLPINLNDWLSELVKTSKRKRPSNRKVPKEDFVTAAIMLLKWSIDYRGVDWTVFDNLKHDSTPEKLFDYFIQGFLNPEIFDTMDDTVKKRRVKNWRLK